LSDAEHEAAREASSLLNGYPLIVCGPGTKMPAKDWGRDNWRELLGRVDANCPGHGLALVGAMEEFDGAEHAAGRWTGPKVNLCGRLSPRETAALLAHARIFLGPDSGPMHLAACMGVSCVIPFAAAGLPGVWFPQGHQHQVVYHRTSCAGCALENCNVAGHPCLASITVDEMEVAVARAMSGQPGNSTITAIS
jgi:heptosyltransferase-3